MLECRLLNNWQGRPFLEFLFLVVLFLLLLKLTLHFLDLCDHLLLFALEQHALAHKEGIEFALFLLLGHAVSVVAPDFLEQTGLEQVSIQIGVGNGVAKLAVVLRPVYKELITGAP